MTQFEICDFLNLNLTALLQEILKLSYSITNGLSANHKTLSVTSRHTLPARHGSQRRCRQNCPTSDSSVRDNVS
ncbi:unnamed protein product [Clavelina lepadiformis]|uniref:Uncharacterized protein n=1 Tax=Clavelina lepadiformis TaxID=159417 RepID=A0ABP0GDY6_CLALP